MLYLDSSALVKRYVREAGSDAVWERLAREERIYTSALSYAEILAALGRKYRAGELSEEEFTGASKVFLEHWQFRLTILTLDARTLNALAGLVRKYPLKGADAVHLSTALWLRDSSAQTPPQSGEILELEFGVADRSLAQIARHCGLAVFNPESAGS